MIAFVFSQKEAGIKGHLLHFRLMKDVVFLGLGITGPSCSAFGPHNHNRDSVTISVLVSCVLI